MSRRSQIGSLSYAAVLLVAASLGGQEPDAEAESKREPFEVMRATVREFECTAQDATIPQHFNLDPIFRYSDPARGFASAAIWKLGGEGRPIAILATELRPKTSLLGRPKVNFEFLSLHATPFSVRSGRGEWNPAGSGVEFKPLSEESRPNDSPQQRLIQMKNLARRFAATEELRQDRYELRLLTSPIDRYQPTGVQRADGTVFLFAYGTNPEVVLFIETDGNDWSFAAGRLTGAEAVNMTFDRHSVWQAPPLKYGITQPYTALNSPVDVPGIEP